jgi:tetraprenyl-beta-curcumene synthase
VFVARKIPTKVVLISRLVIKVLPEVDRELARWQARVEECPQPELARQAASSIRLKRFHAQGGSVFACQSSGGFRRDLVRIIVALQTISDYLDNLCDRAGCRDRHAFRQLHEAILCAVDPDREVPDFYRLYPYSNDGGYLRALVDDCRDVLRTLPTYHLVQEEVAKLAGLYSDLQVYKHVEPWARESLLTSWFDSHHTHYPGIDWWEFAAATGSTLGIFALLAAATRHDLGHKEVQALVQAYFPWVCSLHILLDYFIDQEEDREDGELNFCSYYPNLETCSQRLRLFLAESLERVAELKHSSFHRTVVKGLLALYLSDPKVHRQGLESVAAGLLREAGLDARVMYRMCRGLRRSGVI